MGEFDLIRRYFSFHEEPSEGVEFSVGDDCAALSPVSCPLLLSTDTLVEGTHFPADAPADWIAERAVRVTASDLAAMGARPVAATLGLTLPRERATDPWLRPFSEGLRRGLELHGLRLIGGDTTRGPLVLTLTVMGTAAKPLRRHGARPGQRIGVTGDLGGARAALAHPDLTRSRTDTVLRRYWQPGNRIAAGQVLAEHAASAIDVSDGLLADLGHILQASGVGARLDSSAVPVCPGLPEREGLAWALTGGDDYELCFTCEPEACGAIEEALKRLQVPVSWIGRVIGPAGLFLDDECVSGELKKGYDHFG